GRLLPIEQALAGIGASAAASRPAPPPQPVVASATREPAPREKAASPPRRTGPSPFELDLAKKSGTRPPEPQSSGANALAPALAPQPMAAGDPREKLHLYFTQNGKPHLADAVENAGITVAGADLQVVAPKS